MRYDTLFWDWNGTIIDDLDASIKSVNDLLKARNLKTFNNNADYHDVFCFPVIEYYKKAGFDFEKEKFENLAVEYVNNYNEYSKQSVLFLDIISAITQFKRMGIKQIILSASEVKGLKDWLQRLDIVKYFDDVIGNNNIFAVGKAQIAKSWLENHPEINLNKAVLIGDTKHDFEVASAMKVDCILISRGHNNKKDLLTTDAYVVDDGIELTEYLTKHK